MCCRFMGGGLTETKQLTAWADTAFISYYNVKSSIDRGIDKKVIGGREWTIEKCSTIDCWSSFKKSVVIIILNIMTILNAKLIK